MSCMENWRRNINPGAFVSAAEEDLEESPWGSRGKVRRGCALDGVRLAFPLFPRGCWSGTVLVSSRVRLSFLGEGCFGLSSPRVLASRVHVEMTRCLMTKILFS
jgi:hypothetical protein